MKKILVCRKPKQITDAIQTIIYPDLEYFSIKSYMFLKRIQFYSFLFVLLFCNQIQGQALPLSSSQKAHKTAGDILVGTLPVLALSSTFIWKDGEKGTYQFAKALTGTIAVSYGLKLIVNKERPNGENNNSFPSAHTSVAFTSAAFIQKRYGWQYGIPAYLVAGYVGFTRIEADKHDGWDVAAGAAIGIGMSYLFTKPYITNKKLTMSSSFIEDTPTLGFIYKF